MEICKNYLKIIPSDLVFDIALTELSIADPTYFHMIWLLIHSELWMYTIQILFCQGIFPMEPYIILILSFVTTSQSHGNPFVRESHKGLPFLPDKGRCKTIFTYFSILLSSDKCLLYLNKKTKRQFRFWASICER